VTEATQDVDKRDDPCRLETVAEISGGDRTVLRSHSGSVRRNPAPVVQRVTAPLDAAVADQAADLLRGLVTGGAALGWVDPPPADDVRALLAEVTADAARGDAALVVAAIGDTLAGLGYWRRYARPTHRVHADIEKVAVEPRRQGQGIGRAVMAELVAAAREAGVEVLTLDFRADNQPAARLYASLGFEQYGRLRGFVAVGDLRYDKVFYALDLRVHRG
jgi:ribosomal protein S18 acetylase RimI-like enzyme